MRISKRQSNVLRSGYIALLILVLFLAIWSVLGFSPKDRLDWWAENIPVAAAVILLISTHRAFPFSNISYGLFALFFIMHAVGGHYTYSEVPFGRWLQNSLSLHRNPYDRLVHFAYGLLLAFPAQEFIVRKYRIAGFWRWVLPPMALLAMSAVYELSEVWGALIIGGDTAQRFQGAQGDSWDSQHDIEMGLLGAVITMIVIKIKSARFAERI